MPVFVHPWASGMERDFYDFTDYAKKDRLVQQWLFGVPWCQVGSKSVSEEKAIMASERIDSIGG